MNTYFQLLEWDSNFFEFNVTKINSILTNDAEFDSMQCLLLENNVRLAYLFVEPGSLMDVFFQSKNIFLADEKVTYSKIIDKKNNYTIDNNIKSNNEEQVTEKMLDIAIQTSEHSRFRIDEKLPQNSFKKMYFQWIYNAVNDKENGKLFVYNDDNLLKGLIYLKEINQNIGSISLIGVDQGYRGEQIGSKLIQQCEVYFNSSNKKEVQVVTQKANELACKFYEKNGFVVKDIVNVYHWWL